MKKGVLNYSMTWNQGGKRHEELYYSKLSMVKAYVDMLTRHWETGYQDDGISALTLWEIYRADKPAKDITCAVNRFLA